MKRLIIIIILFIGLNYLLGDFQAPDWSRNLSIYEVNVRQYTEEGTFEAFRQHLPRLQEMGVGILWLMPINPISELNRKGSLGSYYASSDYYGINPEFGSEEDFRSLIEDIHSRGMYVIIDWVANHTGWDNVWTEKHPEYYKKDSSGNFYPPVKDWADVIWLDYSNTGLRGAMADVMAYWVREFDIDGFRCDVAAMVPLDFWIEARTQIERIKPVFMLAECENANYHQAFDMTYAWSAYGIFKDISTGYKSVIELDAYRMREMRHYDNENIRMLFLSNHDENSWSGTMLKHFPESYKAMTVLTYALPGMPLTYSGQEALNDRQLKFFGKDQIKWQSTEMDELYRTLNKLKRGNPALFSGSNGGGLKKVGNTAPYQIYSIVRESGNDELLFVLNLGADELEFQLKSIDGIYQDIITGEILNIDSRSTFTLSAWDYLIYKRER
ncbi:MAG: Beta-galactosidase C-terminal domain [Candidatus Cloacimonetes bacterium]|nr:Beta-galactosidase C-terminal domain [Candidatus Cloacimonadota bacterium]